MINYKHVFATLALFALLSGCSNMTKTSGFFDYDQFLNEKRVELAEANQRIDQINLAIVELEKERHHLQIIARSAQTILGYSTESSAPPMPQTNVIDSPQKPSSLMVDPSSQSPGEGGARVIDPVSTLTDEYDQNDRPIKDVIGAYDYITQFNPRGKPTINDNTSTASNGYSLVKTSIHTPIKRERRKASYVVVYRFNSVDLGREMNKLLHAYGVKDRQLAANDQSVFVGVYRDKHQASRRQKELRTMTGMSPEIEKL